MKKNIVLVTETDLVEFRFKNILSTLDFEYNLKKLDSKKEIFHKIDYNQLAGDIYIIDMNNPVESFEIINRLHENNISDPIIFLSGNKEKTIFLEAIKFGIDDFIIKPFDDRRMVNTLNKYLSKNHIVAYDKIKNHQKDITLEMKRAKKGSYPITFLVFSFIGKNKLYLANKYMKKLKEEMWDTDKALFYTKYSIIGIFPFSGEDDKHVIEEKMNFYYLSIKEKERIFFETEMNMKSLIFSKDIGNYEELISEIDKNIKE